MDLTTNIIRNVYNIGTNSCSAGTEYCTDGYALYFPCLKDLTKGQDVCFDFYLVDMEGRKAYVSSASNGGTPTLSADNELVDLRDVDAISLNLIGQFNCSFGTFSYPDNISSLQTEEYPVVYTEDFGKRNPCTLQVVKVYDDESDSVDSDSRVLSFYSGTTIYLKSEDTENYIFLGWHIWNEEDMNEDCPDETTEDYLDSKNNVFKFTISKDTIVLAIYKKRKSYTVVVDPTNKSSHFSIDYRNRKYSVWNRDEEIFDDGFSSVENILEGYHMFAVCIPSADVYGNSEDGDENISYEFISWKDGYAESRGRCFEVGKDTGSFESGNTIKLKAFCTGPVPFYELETITDDCGKVDDFDDDENGIYIKIEQPYKDDQPYTDINDYDDTRDDEEYIVAFDFCGDGHTISASEVYQKYIGTEGYAYLNSGTLVLSSDIEGGIKIFIYAKAEDSCDLNVVVNGATAIQSLSSDDFTKCEFYFSKCENSTITISSDGECLIDKIEICKEEFIDKGKAQLCLNSETTLNLPSGKLSVNGAVVVDGSAYGLAMTQIGNVNKLPKIIVYE